MQEQSQEEATRPLKTISDITYEAGTQKSSMATLCSAIYILEPTAIESMAENTAVKLSNEYGKSSTCIELKQLLLSMGYQQVHIFSISIENFGSVIQQIVDQGPVLNGKCDFVVVNLCDGCETDGYPGLSILKKLEDANLPFTGSSSYFYNVTTSKPVLKRLLIEKDVPTSDFIEITDDTTEQDVDHFAQGKFPLIIKPSISYASISISDKSVVFNAKEALTQSKSVNGVNATGGVFAERFLGGSEFTVFLSSNTKGDVKIYTPVERVFNSKLKHYERILAFDRYWDGYSLDGVQTDKPVMEVYKYAIAPAEVQDKIKDIALKAFLALGGNGYGRVDMRSDAVGSSNIQVLEVNANCGISFNPNEFTSTVAEILRLSNASVHLLVNDLIGFALVRK